MDVIAKRIKEIRLESGLSQIEFGHKLSVSQDTVSLWETAKSIPTTEMVIAICKTFNCSSDYVLGLCEY